MPDQSPPSLEEEGQGLPALTLSQVGPLLKGAKTVTDVVQILQRVRPPLEWANEEDLLDSLPTNSDIATVRRVVGQMIGHALKRQSGTSRRKTRATRKTKRKHFRKRTSRRT